MSAGERSPRRRPAILDWILELVNPRRKDRAVPLGRVAIVSVAIAALVFAFYSLLQDRVRLPLVSNPYTIELELPYAAGLDAENEPGIGVAGTLQGKIVDVRYEDGKGIATAELDSSARGKVFRDAQIDVRPLNIVNVLVVNILPGDPEVGPLPDGGRIPGKNTLLSIASDKVLGVLDADTRAYAKILLGETATALDGRGGELGRALEELGPLTDSTTEVADALADRRRLVSKLTAELDTVFSTLGRRREQLASVVDSGSAVVDVTSSRETELAASLRRLPAVLSETRGALRETTSLAGPLGEAADELRPVAGELAPALRQGRELLPTVDDLLADVDSLVERGMDPVESLDIVSRRLEPAIAEATPDLREIKPLLDTLIKFGPGVEQFSDLASGLLSTNNVNGPTARVLNVAVEPPRPENLGFGGAARGSRSKLERKLALALDLTCAKVNPLACLTRFQTPGLPGSSIARDGEPVEAKAAEKDRP